ncbi:MAG: AsmA family protein [Gammaproteobacteria bacterium]
MKTFRITLGVLGVLLVLFIAGLFYLADYLDKHQDLLVQTASEALGREVRIEDGVTMHWSMTPSIALEGVWVANAEWARGEYLARAERAVLQFDIAALLQRRLDIRQITLVNADIRLETGSKGRQNWAFGDQTSSTVALQIDRLECEDSRLHYRPLAGPEQQLAITDLVLVGFGGDDVSLKARLGYRKFVVSVSATARSDPADRSAGMQLQGRMTSGDVVMEFTGHATAPLESVDLKVDLSDPHAGLHVTLDGTLARLDGIAGSHFDVNASGPSLSRLAPWTGVDMPETRPFSFAARLQGSEQRLDLKNIKTRVGTIDVAGELQIPLRAGGRIEGTLSSGSLDLTPLLATGDEDSADAAALLAWELPPDALDYPDAALRLEVAHFRAGDVSFEGVTLDASLASDHLKLLMADRAKNLNIALDLKPEAPGWRLHVRNNSKLDLGSLIETEKGQDARSGAPVAVDVDLNGHGRSLGQVLGSANGHIGMVVGAGQLSKEASDRLPLGSVLESLLGAIDSKRKTESRSQLECAVIQLEVVDGIATSRKGLALRTDSVNVLGGGAVKLDTGEIDLHFKTAQRKGLGISILGLADSFIRLSGTLRQPRVEMNAVGFLTHGGAAWATGGLSLLYDSLSRRLTASSNPCESVLKAGASQQD